MASVERTAYPLLPSQLPAKELHRSYPLSDSEIEWVNNTAKSPALSIGLAIQLKVFQHLHYFVPFDELPQELISHVRQCLRYGVRIAPRYSNPRTLYRHQAAIRQYLQVTPFYSSDGLAVTEQIARDCTAVLEQRVDLINAMIDELIPHSTMSLKPLWRMLRKPPSLGRNSGANRGDPQAKGAARHRLRQTPERLQFAETGTQETISQAPGSADRSSGLARELRGSGCRF